MTELVENLRQFPKPLQGRRVCWTAWSAPFAKDAPPCVGTSYILEQVLAKEYHWSFFSW